MKSERMRGFYNERSAPESVKRLYSALKEAWCADTCAPRMRKNWSKDNPSLGQCSVTAFLVQDIMGGEVFGVPLEDGNFHCFNVIEGTVFDLTSEQLDTMPEYTLEYPQSRDTHFEKAEKKARYELLKRRYTEAEQ